MAVRDERSGTTAQGKPSDNLLFRLARDHLALLVPIIGALIFAFRCVIVSAGDLYVAFILATQTSVADAIRALLFAVIPALLFLLSIVTAFTVGMRIHCVDRHNYVSRYNFKVLGMGLVSVASSLGYEFLIGGFQEEPLTSTFVILSYPFMAFVLTALIEFQRGTDRARKAQNPPRLPGAQSRERQNDQVSKLQIEVSSVLIRKWAIWGGIYLLITLLLFDGLLGVGSTLVDKTFWLPPERLAFQYEAPFTGYVLKTSEDHLIILNDRSRIIVEKPKATLQDRDFCYPEDHKARSSKLAADSPVCP
jgi:hypothetical protein